MAAAELPGLPQVLAIRLQHLTEAKRAYRIADKRLAELSSFGAELLGLELQALDEHEFEFPLELTGFDGARIDGPLELTSPGPVSSRWGCLR